MLAAAMAGLAICVVLVLLYSYFAATTVLPQQFAWLALVSIAGSWAVLIPAKFWEGTKGDPMLRRFILMVIGLALGGLAFGVSSLLLVDLPADQGQGFDFFHLSPGKPFYDVGGHPLAAAFMAYFGTLYFLMRWWLQADPLRASRLSLWSMFVSVVVAVVVAGVWSFPAQSWLVMVTAAISASVQLSSPWVPPRERVRHKAF